MRVVEYLSEQRVAFKMLPHPPAFDVRRLAAFLGVEDGHVARAVLLHGPEGPFLGVLPATHQADVDLLSRLLGGPVRVARNDEAAAVFRDCEWGAVSPFGNLYGLPALLDVRLDPDTEIHLEAGTHVEAVRLNCRDYERLSGALRADFARPLSRASQADS